MGKKSYSLEDLSPIYDCFKVENNSLELTRIFKESFRDQRWAWEESVGAEKRDRDAERVSLHLYLSSPLLHFLLKLTFGL